MVLRSFSLGRLASAYPNFYEPDQLAAREYTIQEKAASLYEYNVSLALDSLGFDYIFQVNIFGGRMELGGIVLDFLVDTVPLPTPLWVHGEYWHTGAAREKDLYQQAQIEDQMGNQLMPAIEIWGWQAATPELARMWLARYL